MYRKWTTFDSCGLKTKVPRMINWLGKSVCVNSVQFSCHRPKYSPNWVNLSELPRQMLCWEISGTHHPHLKHAISRLNMETLKPIIGHQLWGKETRILKFTCYAMRDKKNKKILFKDFGNVVQYIQIMLDKVITIFCLLKQFAKKSMLSFWHFN